MSEPDPNRPQPVMDAAKQLGSRTAAAFIAIGLVWFLVTGGITRDNLSAVGAAIGAAVTAVAALVLYLYALARGRAAAAQVTPVVDPHDNAGQRLLPADVYADTYGEHAGRHEAHDETPVERP